MKTKKIILGAIMILALVVSAAVIFAQEGHKHGQHGDRGAMEGGFFHDLNLSDAQKEQIKQISAKYKPGMKSLHEQMRAIQKSGFDPMTGAQFDANAEAALRSQAQARANLEIEMQVTHARMMSEMFAVLTPEQKTQLAQKRQQWQQKHQEKEAAETGSK